MNETMNEEASSENAETPSSAAAAPKAPVTWRYVLGVAVLGLWVLALGVYGLDRALGLGFFPTELERLLRANVQKLTDADPAVAERAEKELFDYHGFSVPFLIKGMRNGSEPQKEACAACLKRIAAHYYGAKPDCGADADKWARWWAEMDRRMTELIDREAVRLQNEIEEETRQEHR